MKTIVLVLGLGVMATAATAAAQPAGSGSAGSGSAAVPAPDGIMIKPADVAAAPPDKGACVALARQDVEWFRGQCTTAVAEAITALPALEAARVDQIKSLPMGATPPPRDPTLTWVDAVIDQTWPVVKRYKAEDLTAQANAAHDKAAQEIATDRRHVVLAYGAMWLLSVGFLIYLWRRQQGLRGQIDELKRDLEAAIKDGS